jgi:drug/metabolite transporter (DMT)-like permease
MKNGNIAIKADKAMWLAIAQPSSALKCRKASVAILKMRRMENPGYPINESCPRLFKPRRWRLVDGLDIVANESIHAVPASHRLLHPRRAADVRPFVVERLHRAKYAVPYAEPFTFLVARFGITIVVLVLIALASRAPWPATAGDAGHSMVAGALLHGGYLAGVWWAVARGLPAGLAGLLTALQPLLTALLAAPLLGEKVTSRQWLGIVGGSIGIVLVLAPRLGAVDVAALGDVALPMIVNLGAIVSVTLGTFYQKRFVARADLRTGTCLQYVGALAIVTPLALATEALRFDPTVTLLAALAWSVLAMSIAAIALLLLLIRHGEISRVAALIYLVPPFTALEAFILFGESPEQRSSRRNGRRRLRRLAGDAASVAAVELLANCSRAEGDQRPSPIIDMLALVCRPCSTWRNHACRDRQYRPDRLRRSQRALAQGDTIITDGDRIVTSAWRRRATSKPATS